MGLHQPDPEEMDQIAKILNQALNPMAKMDEDQKAEIELMSIVHQSFNFDNALRRMADLSEKKAKRTKAEIFAAGVITALVTGGYISPFPNRITELSALHTIAHWFKTFERYLEQGEV
jgi:hypothetical protein